MLNQWARSYQLSMSTWIQALKPSIPNQWARSYLLLTSTRTQAQLVCFNEDQITSITVIKAESIPTNLYFEIYVTC